MTTTTSEQLTPVELEQMEHDKKMRKKVFSKPSSAINLNKKSPYICQMMRKQLYDKVMENVTIAGDSFAKDNELNYVRVNSDPRFNSDPAFTIRRRKQCSAENRKLEFEHCGAVMVNRNDKIPFDILSEDPFFDFIWSQE
jgi:hypothetical protein